MQGNSYHPLHLYIFPAFMVWTCLAASFLRAKMVLLALGELLHDYEKGEVIPGNADKRFLANMTTPDMGIGHLDLAESDRMFTPREHASEKFVAGVVELFAYVFTTNGRSACDVLYLNVSVVGHTVCRFVHMRRLMRMMRMSEEGRVYEMRCTYRECRWGRAAFLLLDRAHEN